MAQEDYEMNVAIVTDSNSGIFEEEGKILGVHVIPMPVILEGKTYYEGIDLTHEEFYQCLEEKREVFSSQPSPAEVLDMWDKLLLSEYDELVYIPMSSGLSGSCQTAQVLAQAYEEKVQVVDNHRISVTQRQSVLDALMLKEKGCSAKEIKEALEQTAYESIVYVGVETLEYLKMGGRVTPAGAAMGTLMFLEMWELCCGIPDDIECFFPKNEVDERIESDGFVQPYSDSPVDNENVGEHVYLQIINNAKDYVYICTPYLIVDDSMVSALCLASKSGVDVRIITPHIYDKALIHLTTRSFYRELIYGGVKIYEYSKGFMHSKIFVSDDQIATVGTTNLDFRSLYLHFECGVWMYNSKAVLQIKKDYFDTLNECTQITLEECIESFLYNLK